MEMHLNAFQFEAIQGKQVEIKRFRISFYLISMQVFFCL